MNYYTGFVFVGGFVLGGIIGALLTKRFIAKTYSESAKKQIDEVVEYYRNRSEANKPETEKKEESEKKVPEEKAPDIQTEEKEPEMEVISIGDYCMVPGYVTESFTLYGDGILTNDADIPLSDVQINRIFGPDIYDKICQCEDSCIYVRNPMECIDYEIDMCPTEFTG